MLERLIGNLGVEVRYESMTERPGASAGGLCRLRTQRLVLIDAGAPAVEQVGVLLDALGQLDLEAMFVPPLVRLLLARRRR
jgi:hypothetical protein